MLEAAAPVRFMGDRGRGSVRGLRAGRRRNTAIPPAGIGCDEVSQRAVFWRTGVHDVLQCSKGAPFGV